MRIESITIENYKVFKKTTITNLPKMAVFCGVNGSGKSTLFDIFDFLSDALQSNLNAAITRRGGFKEVISRGSDFKKDFIKFTLVLRNTEKENEYYPEITYFLEIGFKEIEGKVYINRENLKYSGSAEYSSFWLLDFNNGAGKALANEKEYYLEGQKAEYEYQKMTSPDILAIKGLGQFERFKAISAFISFLGKWHVSNFSIENGIGISGGGVSEHLSVSGHNLAQVTKYMYDYFPAIFDSILKKLRKRIPGINNVEAIETQDGRIILRFQDQNFKDPFNAKQVSGGTIIMFAYMILLNDPNPHPLLCLEEPEVFFHPDLLFALSEDIREYSEKGGQVFISTHSPDFVNGLNIEELFYLLKIEGFSTIHAVKDDPMVNELAKENQLGWLWRNNYIKGANL